MEDFPSNSKRPRRREERDTERNEKKIERVVTSNVKRRKTPLGKRMSQHILGGDAQSAWGYIIGDVLIPAARDMIMDAVYGGMERVIFPDSVPSGRRSRRSHGYTPYNRYHKEDRRRDEGRRDISRRGRANHSFDEIVLETRAEAEEVLDRLDHTIDKYNDVSVADLYEMVGISGNWVDDKWGWTDLRGARAQRVRDGYLLDLPRPEPLE